MADEVTKEEVKLWLREMDDWERLKFTAAELSHAYIEPLADLTEKVKGDRKDTLKYFLGIGLPAVILIPPFVVGVVTIVGGLI